MGAVAPPSPRRAGLTWPAWRGGRSELAMQTAMIVYTALAVGGSLGFLFGAMCAAGKDADQGEPF